MTMMFAGLPVVVAAILIQAAAMGVGRARQEY